MRTDDYRTARRTIARYVSTEAPARLLDAVVELVTYAFVDIDTDADGNDILTINPDKELPGADTVDVLLRELRALPAIGHMLAELANHKG